VFGVEWSNPLGESKVGASCARSTGDRRIFHEHKKRSLVLVVDNVMVGETCEERGRKFSQHDLPSSPMTTMQAQRILETRTSSKFPLLVACATAISEAVQGRDDR
jgi:hypothetical protein